MPVEPRFSRRFSILNSIASFFFVEAEERDQLLEYVVFCGSLKVELDGVFREKLACSSMQLLVSQVRVCPHRLVCWYAANLTLAPICVKS